ncbi:hypothetical protein T265_15821, partial [Opisthorchis viverrini]
MCSDLSQRRTSSSMHDLESFRSTRDFSTACFIKPKESDKSHSCLEKYKEAFDSLLCRRQDERNSQ